MKTESELHENQEVWITVDGEDLLWIGDLTADWTYDTGDMWTAPYTDLEVRVSKTDTLQRFNEDADVWEDVEVTQEIIYQVEETFRRTL